VKTKVKGQPAPDAGREKQFLEEMNHALAGWSDPAEHLRDALQKDERQLHCQPILTLRSGRFELAEVLVRLREEENALLPPEAESFASTMKAVGCGLMIDSLARRGNGAEQRKDGHLTGRCAAGVG
jgi:predicted signal transduction protein with EAL and GGDEF domain